MSGKVFVDTNILLYARDAGQPQKLATARSWMEALWRGQNGRLSFQVLQEFYVNVTQKLKPGLPVADARRDLRALLAWNPLSTNATLLDAAWELMDHFGFSWWDAQIVAAARIGGCVVLLTEDMQDRLDVWGTRILNPFTTGAPNPGDDLTAFGSSKIPSVRKAP
ncbi:MAG: PIN domain-containing protein [Acidiferrobacter sp.]